MSRIEPEEIERALKAIEAENLAPNGTVSSEVLGYVASFGAAVIQSGLVAAVVFFGQESTDSDAKDRPKLIRALHYMMGSPGSTLLQHLRANPNDLLAIESDLLEKAVALKLALRTFSKPKTPKPTAP